MHMLAKEKTTKLHFEDMEGQKPAKYFPSP